MPTLDFDLNYLKPYVVFGIAVYIVFNIYQKLQYHLMLKRWSTSSRSNKNVVILHCYQRGTTIPNLSPFVLKLETYLRMANINYKIDIKDYAGPKGKSPWISFNGENIADSQLIIEFLSKKFDQSLNGSYSVETLAIGTLARVTLEEHVFWGLGLWCLCHDTQTTITKKCKLPWIAIKLGGRNIQKQTWHHGIGRHTKAEIEHLLFQDLRAISQLLGNNKYFLGNEPVGQCDPAMFGFLAQLIWGIASGSPYEKLVNDELPNIKEYCIRMKEKYYADWNSILDK